MANSPQQLRHTKDYALNLKRYTRLWTTLMLYDLIRVRALGVHWGRTGGALGRVWVV